MHIFTSSTLGPGSNDSNHIEGQRLCELFVNQWCDFVQVRSGNGRRAPSWLAVDSKHGLISGVPQKQDLGPHTFTVTAHGNTRGLTATDSFTVEVSTLKNCKHGNYGILNRDSCRVRQNHH